MARALDQHEAIDRIEVWVGIEPDEREVLIVKARPTIGAPPRWRVTLSRTSAGGSCIGKHDDSLSAALDEALRIWERVHGAAG